jgi:hypothetical protein
MLHTSLAFHERLTVSRCFPLKSEGELQPLFLIDSRIRTDALARKYQGFVARGRHKNPLMLSVSENDCVHRTFTFYLRVTKADYSKLWDPNIIIFKILQAGSILYNLVSSHSISNIFAFLLLHISGLFKVVLLLDMGSSGGDNFFAKSCFWCFVQIVGFDKAVG